MTNTITINDLPILNSPNVHMKNEKDVFAKMNKIIKDSVNKLQVVTDFDMTITKQHVDGKIILTSFGIFMKSTQISEDYKEQSQRQYDKYRPIEIDPNVPLDVKIKATEEWNLWEHQQLLGCTFDPQEIEELAQKYGSPFRDRANEFFVKLKNSNVPVLIFSAGLGDMVEAELRNKNCFYENVKVISNFLNFDGHLLNGFKNCMAINVFNKNEHAVEDEYFTIWQGRTNVILMGDSLGDSSMADGVEATETILRIGFLYEHVEERLEQFKDAFDIVLIDDQTMNVVLSVLDAVL